LELNNPVGIGFRLITLGREAYDRIHGTESVRGRKDAIYHDSIQTEITTWDVCPFGSLLAHRKLKDEDEYLVQWSPIWEKGSSISNLRDVLRTLKETKVKMWAKSTLVAPSENDVEEAKEVVADAIAKWSKKVQMRT
jgi:hypothetical protein